MLRKIPCEEIKLGMYVHSLGGSWLSHPFWRTKFTINSHEDLELLRASALPYVTIDVALGCGPDEPEVVPQEVKLPAAGLPKSARRMLVAGPQRYQDGSWDRSEADRRQAINLVNRSKDTIKRVFEAVRLGESMQSEAVLPIVDDVTGSIERDAHTLLNVIHLKTKNEYIFYHSIAVCTLMINLALHLNLGMALTREFGLAGLLHDIGKMGIPDEVLNKPGLLDDEEISLMRSHPELGHKLLSNTPNMSESALDACLNHHERMDSAGYPSATSRDKISLVARAAAICDVYDAITSDRAYKTASSPANAVPLMWDDEGHFDRDLLFRFFLSIGVLPERQLVMLRSNRLGVTLPHRRRFSRPRVCAFYNARDREWLTPEVVTIREDLSGDQILSLQDPAHWELKDWGVVCENLMKGQNRA